MNSIFKIDNASYYISKNVFSDLQTPKRTVSNYEIELYTTAENISVVNGVRHSQSAGNVLISRPGDTRCSIGSFECFCVHFSCSDPETCRVLDELPVLMKPSDTESIKHILQSLSAPPVESGALRSMFLCGCLMELISLLSAYSAENRTVKYPRYVSSVFSACEYMERNSDKHITLSDISAAANLSPGFFHSVFKSIKGTTPAEYLCDIRINRAKKLLRGSNLPLAEIAVVCGFGSQGYFNYVFKKKTSLTPKGYRDKKRIII